MGTRVWRTYLFCNVGLANLLALHVPASPQDSNLHNTSIVSGHGPELDIP